MLKIASWNVNSLKVRLDQVLQWLDTSTVDILALQETKLVNEDFPLEFFQKKGFYAVFSGQKTYNGVAIISKDPILDIMTDVPGLEDPQRRILAATIGDLRLINLYVPNGAAVDSDKYDYKLMWLKKVTCFIQQQLCLFPYLVVLGDFNIAPEDCDVYSPKEWEGHVLVSKLERQAFFSLIDLGLKDSFRLFSQDVELYSWWDYRAAGFRRNRGLRIDHILLSEALTEKCLQSAIDIEPRRSERPSDHAPVWVMLDHLCD